MALRTRSATSGPGRAPGSDGRARHGRARRGNARTGPGTPLSYAVGRPGGPTDATTTPPAAASTAASPTTVTPRTTAAPTTARSRAEALFAGAPAAPGRPGEAPPDADPASPGAGETAGDRGRRRERLGPAMRERLPMWVMLRCGLEPRTLAALAVVLVVAVVLAVQHFWTARPHEVGVPEPVRAAAVVPEPSPSAEPKRVVVDVGGKVRQPGVLRLPAGSRVADALRAAGGVKPGADITGLNRARVLMDGEQVVVGGPAPPGAGAVGGVGGGGGVVGGSGGGGAGPVSLNSGTLEQFDTLPGVGPVLARRIVDYRTQRGGFRSIGELREVNGIGERRFADLEPLVRP
ncbi:ComEA family DNA-binding protein [Streptomyces sp. NPDC006923]|uniref:ComEA family DNA-binding protein n=1 Tax=Streptomyces sp. NPDC006923 TaxID=3155355 RepID=UPI0033FCA5A9